ncbi:hypothetical protein B0H10DRAFT_2222751 [Mycena sp. CBHHK59/15]|nr:hypothetical protein B0H10DRAFT_2222751 [Mycena sp. CBHHK59/15]
MGMTIPLALLGLLPTIIIVALPNPSVFPQCRLLTQSPTPLLVNLVPCLRAVFDAAATLVLLITFLWVRKEVNRPWPLLSLLLCEETKDIALISLIIAMEAVFVQIPSAHVHARNFIAPFVDSTTAVLATRFIVEMAEFGAEGVAGDHDASTALQPETSPTPSLWSPESRAQLNQRPSPRTTLLPTTRFHNPLDNQLSSASNSEVSLNTNP